MRWSTILVVVALGLSGCAWLIWVALYQANGQVSSQLVGFRVVDAHRVDVTIQVDRTTSVAATCRVTAQAGDQALVGDLTFVVPAQEASSVIVNQSVPTERLATNAVLHGCTTAEQPQPR